MIKIKPVIDRRSSSSIFDQITEDIKKRILERQLRNGDVLPNIDAFALDLDVPKQAIRMAYQHLLDLKLIEKMGPSFVVSSIELPDLFNVQLMTMTQAISLMGLTPKIMQIDEPIILSNPVMNQHMGFNQNEQILKCRRIYLGDEVPIFYVESFFPLSVFPKLDTHDFSSTPYYDLFKNHYQILITESYRIFTSAGVTSEVATILRTAKGKPLYHTITSAKDQYGRHVEYGEIWSTSNHKQPMALEKDDIITYFM
jgi:GntR family transcriptional regulator